MHEKAATLLDILVCLKMLPLAMHVRLIRDRKSMQFIKIESPSVICIHKYVYTYIHTYIHTYIQTYIHTNIHTYKHTYIQTYIHTNIHTYIQTYIHTNIHTYKHTYIQTYIHTLFIYKLNDNHHMKSCTLTHPLSWNRFYPSIFSNIVIPNRII